MPPRREWTRVRLRRRRGRLGLVLRAPHEIKIGFEMSPAVGRTDGRTDRQREERGRGAKNETFVTAVSCKSKWARSRSRSPSPLASYAPRATSPREFSRLIHLKDSKTADSTSMEEGTGNSFKQKEKENQTRGRSCMVVCQRKGCERLLCGRDQGEKLKRASAIFFAL